MKRLIPILILSAAVAVCAQSPFQMVIARKNAGAGCDAATEYLGRTNEVGAVSGSMTDGTLYLTLFTPTCSGDLNTAYAYHALTDTDNIKLAIYLDDGDNVPDAGDTRIYLSGEITTAITGWASEAVSGTVSVSTGNSYWVGGISDATGWRQLRDTSTGTTYYMGSVGYTSIPTDLTGSWTSLTREQLFYFSIGD